MIKYNFKAAYYHYKDRDTLIEKSNTPIEQTLLTKYSNKAVTNVCGLGKMWAKLGKQNVSENKKNYWKKLSGKKAK